MKKAQRKTNECFENEVSQIYEGKYKLKEKYINNTTKLKFYHPECDYYFYATPRDFLQGKSGCPKCRNIRLSKSVTKSHQHFLKRLGDSLGDNYLILSTYKNGRTKIKLKHLKCGIEFSSLPGHILEGKRCPECWKKENGLRFRKSHEQFKKDLGENWFENFELLGKYKKQTSKICVRHKRCGNTFEVTPDSLLAGSGCPRCKESRGEKIITKILYENSILYKAQYKFDDCVYKDKLRFDFAILGELTNVIALVEYQGIQHYKAIEYFDGAKSLEIQQVRDKIKKEYAKKNKILFFEVKYNENIYERMNEILLIIKNKKTDSIFLKSVM